MSSRFSFLNHRPHPREWLSRREGGKNPGFGFGHESLDVLLLSGTSPFLVFGACVFSCSPSCLSPVLSPAISSCFQACLQLEMPQEDKIELGSLREADWKRKRNGDRMLSVLRDRRCPRKTGLEFVFDFVDHCTCRCMPLINIVRSLGWDNRVILKAPCLVIKPDPRGTMAGRW